MIVRVVAAITRHEGKILITMRPETVPLPGMWEFPGGKVEAHESPEEALAREIQEELGVQIEVLSEFFRTQHCYGMRTVELRFFEAQILAGEPQKLQVADFCWVSPEELRNYRFPEADEELIALLMET